MNGKEIDCYETSHHHCNRPVSREQLYSIRRIACRELLVLNSQVVSLFLFILTIRDTRRSKFLYNDQHLGRTRLELPCTKIMWHFGYCKTRVMWLSGLERLCGIKYSVHDAEGVGLSSDWVKLGVLSPFKSDKFHYFFFKADTRWSSLFIKVLCYSVAVWSLFMREHKSDLQASEEMH